MSQRERHLVPCLACHRHVMNHEAECPFCSAPLPVGAPEPPRALPRGRFGRAALLAAGASATLISACSSAVVEYGAPVLLDAGSMSDASDGAVGGAAGRGAGGTGAGGAGADAGSVVPLDGAPVPRDGG